MALDYERIAPTIRTEVPVFDPGIGVGTRFRKGVSGNPGGRPRSRLLSEALRNRLGEIKADDPEKRSWAEIIAINLIELAASKSPSAVAAANEIGDRIEGRPRQSIEVSDITSELRSKSDEELRFIWTTSAGLQTKSESCCQRRRMPQQRRISIRPAHRVVKTFHW